MPTTSLCDDPRLVQEIELLPFLRHFGQSVETPEEVRAVAMRPPPRGSPDVDGWEEPDYVSVELRDPDDYAVEVSGEPD